MPRPKKPGAPEPKKRSRNGCWNCKSKKVKCGEEKPACVNCQRQNESCDYSIRLNWDRGGRSKHSDSDEALHSGSSATFSVNDFRRGSLIPPDQPSHGTGMLDLRRGSLIAPDQPSPATGMLDMRRPSLVPAHHSSPGMSSLDLRRPSLVPHDQLPPGLGSPVIGMLDPAISSTPSSVSIRDMPGPGSTASRLVGISSPTSGTQSPDLSAMPFSGTQQPYPTMLPPFQPTFNQFRRRSGGTDDSGPSLDEPPHKKLRFSPSIDPMQPRFSQIEYGSPSNSGRLPPPTTAQVTSYPQSLRSPDTPSSYFGSSGANSNAVLPLTPAASATSDEVFAVPALKRSSIPYAEDDPRRMSVNSLLNAEEEAAKAQPALKRAESQQKVSYGIDRGLPDYDFPTNNDAQALSVITPTSPASHKSFPNIEEEDFSEFGFGLHGLNLLRDEDKMGVEVAIPKSLLPLPSRLHESPMNLLYFNHFVNHVARILVPHDCSQNPFRSILPQMAVRDDNLLCLLLAYSASHRARLLGYREPSTRIAMWLENVFPNLRLALDDPQKQISHSTIATAIMLASREIIAPNTFGTAIPWQAHLDLARRIIAERGGPRNTSKGGKDRVSYFLMRWFAYLDIISTLMSGREAARYRRPSEDASLAASGAAGRDCIPNDPTAPTLSLYTPAYFAPDESAFRIDCLLGFTSRLVSLLARVAHLARRCDVSPGRYLPGGQAHDAGWRPDAATLRAALKLKAEIIDAKAGYFEGCPDADESITGITLSPAERQAARVDAAELAATNRAFHCAALVHLNRRVLGAEQESEEVQGPVKEIVTTLRSLRKGGTAETGFLFPMFTAGVEVVDAEDRGLILDRVKGVEGSGMVQVNKARRLMETVWATGRPWETLVQGEFFG